MKLVDFYTLNSTRTAQPDEGTVNQLTSRTKVDFKLVPGQVKL